MDYKNAIEVINKNWPDKSYSELREALVFAIRTMNNANSEIDLKLASVIVNGKPSEQTLLGYTEKGWNVLKVDVATKYHPYAMPTDYIVFFAKPIDKEAYDKQMAEFKESVGNESCGEKC